MNKSIVRLSQEEKNKKGRSCRMDHGAGCFLFERGPLKGGTPVGRGRAGSRGGA